MGLDSTVSKWWSARSLPSATAWSSPSAVSGRSVRLVCWPVSVHSVSPCRTSHMDMRGTLDHPDGELQRLEHVFYPRSVPEQLFEIARRTFDTPEFRGIEFIEAECKTIINHVPGNYLPFNYTINPYRGCSHSCTYCFARPTHTYLDMNAGKDFESKIVVKVNAPDVLRRELAAKRWKGEHIAMGTNTDPYQRAEGRYRLMRGIIRALVDHRNSFSILTKGTLILRDVDLLQEAAEVTTVSAAFSIGTLDDAVWHETEPGTPHPKARIEAIRTLTEAGIPTGVLMAPVLPGLSDRPEQLREVVGSAIEAGAAHGLPRLLPP